MADPGRLHRLLAALAPHMTAHTSDIEAGSAARRLRSRPKEARNARTARTLTDTATRLFT